MEPPDSYACVPNGFRGFCHQEPTVHWWREETRNSILSSHPHYTGCREALGSSQAARYDSSGFLRSRLPREQHTCGDVMVRETDMRAAAIRASLTRSPTSHTRLSGTLRNMRSRVLHAHVRARYLVLHGNTPRLNQCTSSALGKLNSFGLHIGAPAHQ